MAPLRTAVLVTALCSAVLALLPAGAGAQETASAPAASAAFRLARLAERYYEEQARFEPLDATFSGEHRFDDQLPMTILPAVRARRFGMLHDVQDELMKIDRSKLAGTDLITFDCLGYELNTALAFEPFKDYLLPLNQIDSL